MANQPPQYIQRRIIVSQMIPERISTIFRHRFSIWKWNPFKCTTILQPNEPTELQRLAIEVRNSRKINVLLSAWITCNELRNFIFRQTILTKTRINRYSSNEKMSTILLWRANHKCYRLLTTTFSLPSLTTLRRYMHISKIIAY